jgi:hypothetical protein
VTGSQLKFQQNEEVVDMCVAIENMKQKSVSGSYKNRDWKFDGDTAPLPGAGDGCVGNSGRPKGRIRTEVTELTYLARRKSQAFRQTMPNRENLIVIERALTGRICIEPPQAMKTCGGFALTPHCIAHFGSIHE